MMWDTSFELEILCDGTIVTYYLACFARFADTVNHWPLFLSTFRRLISRGRSLQRWKAKVTIFTGWLCMFSEGEFTETEIQAFELSLAFLALHFDYRLLCVEIRSSVDAIMNDSCIIISARCIPGGTHSFLNKKSLKQLISAVLPDDAEVICRSVMLPSLLQRLNLT